MNFGRDRPTFVHGRGGVPRRLRADGHACHQPLRSHRQSVNRATCGFGRPPRRRPARGYSHADRAERDQSRTFGLERGHALVTHVTRTSPRPPELALDESSKGDSCPPPMVVGLLGPGWTVRSRQVPAAGRSVRRWCRPGCRADQSVGTARRLLRSRHATRWRRRIPLLRTGIAPLSHSRCACRCGRLRAAKGALRHLLPQGLQCGSEALASICSTTRSGAGSWIRNQYMELKHIPHQTVPWGSYRGRIDSYLAAIYIRYHSSTVFRHICLDSVHKSATRPNPPRHQRVNRLRLEHAPRARIYPAAA